MVVGYRMFKKLGRIWPQRQINCEKTIVVKSCIGIIMSFENKITQCDEQKRKIDSLRPIRAQELENLKSFYKVGQTFSSNALEGNTLTEIETKVIVEDGLTVSGKPLKEVYEASGNADAFDFMMGLASGNLFSEVEMLKIHEIFYHRIDQKAAGKYRDIKVFLSGTDVILPDPKDVPQLSKKFIKDIKEKSKTLHPIELAAIVHNEFVTIHPFTDGNGRTARLLMNLILVQNGYSIAIIPPIYRLEYLEISRKGNDGDHVPFTNFLSSMLYESQKDLLRMLE